MSWRGGTYVMEALIQAVAFLPESQRRLIYVPMIKALMDLDWSEPMVFLGEDAAYDAAYAELGLDREE